MMSQEKYGEIHGNI